MNSSHKRCWAEIDLAALRSNVAAIQAQLGGGAGIMAIVKANAYGHGAIPITRELAPLVAVFGVANLDEAEQISEVVDPARIHILGAALPGERKEIVRRGFVPAISSAAEAAEFEWLAGRHQIPITVAIDTGMGRLGIQPEELEAEIAKIAALPHIRIETIATHLPVADENEEFTGAQLHAFAATVQKLRASGIAPPIIQVLNSAGAIRFPGNAYQLARIGLALYGSSPIAGFQHALRPVLALKTSVTLVRALPAGHGVSYGRSFITPHPMRVATLAAGYADGYPRRLSGQGAEVLIRGHRCPILGRVTMDQIMIDVSALPGIAPGDEALLIGRQGPEEITAASLAHKSGTIAWEIFTGISARVERIYLRAAGETAIPAK